MSAFDDPLFRSEEFVGQGAAVSAAESGAVSARHAAAAHLRAAVPRSVGRCLGRRRADRHGGVGARLGDGLRGPAGAVSDGLPWPDHCALPPGGRHVQRAAAGACGGCGCCANWPRRGVSARRRPSCATTCIRPAPRPAEGPCGSELREALLHVLPMLPEAAGTTGPTVGQRRAAWACLPT